MSRQICCYGRVKRAGAFIALFVMTSCLAARATVYVVRLPQSYELCGAYVGSSCSGIVDLAVAQKGSTFQGFATQVTAVPLHAPGEGFIANEISVIQSNGHCSNVYQEPSGCWVEVGLIANFYQDSAETHVFWSYNVPDGYGFYDLGALKTQELNHKVFLMIRPRYLEANAFDVEVETCADVSNDACAQRWMIAQSTNNSMLANVISMGIELVGESGASAPKASFTGNVLLDPNAPFGGTYLTSAGVVVFVPAQVTTSVGSQNPVAAGWAAIPSSSNFGGSFFTACCN